MPNKTTHRTSNAIPASIDAFHELANIYLASAERLSALNFSAIREAVEDFSTVTNSLLEMKTDSGFNKHKAVLAPPTIEKSAAYFRDAYEILTATQQEVTQMLNSQFSGFGANFKMPGDWSKPFDLFAKSIRQLSERAAQSASAATATSSAALAETLLKARKTA